MMIKYIKILLLCQGRGTQPIVVYIMREMNESENVGK